MKRVYTFGNGQAEGRADMKNLLGGKGANLAEMNLIGVPVPPGFTITTEVCTEYNKEGKDAVVKLLEEDVKKAETLSRRAGEEFRCALALKPSPAFKAECKEFLAWIKEDFSSYEKGIKPAKR